MPSIKATKIEFKPEFPFRKFKNLVIPLAPRITLLCGHNGVEANRRSSAYYRAYLVSPKRGQRKVTRLGGCLMPVLQTSSTSIILPRSRHPKAAGAVRTSHSLQH